MAAADCKKAKLLTVLRGTRGKEGEGMVGNSREGKKGSKRKDVKGYGGNGRGRNGWQAKRG